MSTYKGDVPLYVTNPIFQLVSVLLIILLCSNSRDNTVSIGRIMLYMWGLGSKSNLNKLIMLKRNGAIEDIPMTTDASIITVIRQCISDQLVSINQRGKYNLTTTGKSFLFKLRETNLYDEISTDLNSIGKIPESYFKQLEINWYATV